MSRRAVAFAVLGLSFLVLTAEEFFGMIHGSDMCWLGPGGGPFNGPPCPKNYVWDPLQMYFALLWVRLSAFIAVNGWGIPLFWGFMGATLATSLAFFALSLRELDREERSSLGRAPPQIAKSMPNSSQVSKGF